MLRWIEQFGFVCVPAELVDADAFLIGATVAFDCAPCYDACQNKDGTIMLVDIRASALIGLIAALLVPSMAAGQDSDPIAKLGVWAGRWTYHAEIYETPYSHAYAFDGTQDCGWSPNHGFMVCDYLNSNPAPGSPLTDLGVFSYNPTTKTYTRVSVFQESKPFVQDVTIDGNTWTTSATIPYKGKTIIHRDVYVYQSADKRTTTTQLSADGGETWTTEEKFTAVRVSQ